MYGGDAGGCMASDRGPLLVEADLPEAEHLLEVELAVREAGDLDDADDLPRSTAQALSLDDDVHGGGDLLLDRAGGKVGPGHQDHRLQSRQRVGGGVGMDRAD